MAHDKPELGRHGFFGSGDPGPESNCQHHSHYKTFSLGVFRWLPKYGGGLKKGKVLVRVSGPCGDRDAVVARAREIAALLDAGEYVGPKHVRV